jgi:hypothetical protein
MRKADGTVGVLESSIVTIINGKNFFGVNAPNSYVNIYNKNLYQYVKLPCSSVNIDREDKIGNTATIVMSSNDKDHYTDIRYYNPYRGTHGYTPNDWEHVILPNTNIQIYSGYGEHNVIIYDGYIDRVVIDDSKNEITITCRDI